ncbi:hypothetical protein GBA65_21040 (plasmid) [Rubrobacter marinus]|uniref:HTH marR-type domain-containing protein n=1 Tax=Rubrobacter marinus TaxID=2653852 RepID=A0A6G8Q3B4_9ACTN|nr:hypothetical protein [Rubrobacter marinus]QIN80949.1 hypothetical protein GBA65_21040 [Rubrobacter marinus]
MLLSVLEAILRTFGRHETLTHHPAGVPDAEPVFPAPTTPPEAEALPPGEHDRSLALLTVLDALAPVSRATFLALRDVTGLPDVVLLRALRRLTDAGLATVEEGRTGQSTLAFAISDCGREVLGSPYENDPAPERLSRLGTTS